MRGEAFLNFFQQSMQQEQDFRLGSWVIAWDTCIPVSEQALGPFTAHEPGQAANSKRAVASLAGVGHRYGLFPFDRQKHFLLTCGGLPGLLALRGRGLARQTFFSASMRSTTFSP